MYISMITHTPTIDGPIDPVYRTIEIPNKNLAVAALAVAGITFGGRFLGRFTYQVGKEIQNRAQKLEHKNCVAKADDEVA